MSQWLQIAAVARIDDFRCEPVSIEEAAAKFEQIFGKECSWESGDFRDAFEHPDKYLPMGSEGSLTMSIWVNPDTHCLDSYTVSIFGSLRDMGETEADTIIDWFKNKISSELSPNGLGVRNAVIDIESEFHFHKVWVYNRDNLATEFSHGGK